MLMWAGTAVGALLGLAHAVYVYRVFVNGVAADAAPDHVRGIYFAIWTLALWILFGSYVLILWLAGVVLYILFKAFR